MNSHKWTFADAGCEVLTLLVVVVLHCVLFFAHRNVSVAIELQRSWAATIADLLNGLHTHQLGLGAEVGVFFVASFVLRDLERLGFLIRNDLEWLFFLQLGLDWQLQLSAQVEATHLIIMFLGRVVRGQLVVLGRDLNKVAHVEFGEWLERLADHFVLTLVMRSGVFDLGFVHLQ